MEEQEELIKGMNTYNVIAISEHIYNRLPKVFIEGNTLVKVAVTSDFVNCASYRSHSGMTFEGCVIYQNGELEGTKGIYYVPASSVFSIITRRKMTRDLDEMMEIIKDAMQSRAVQGLELNKMRLLIKYDNYSVAVYDKYIKGKVLKFPLKGEQGHLKIIQVPRLSDLLLYEKVTQLVIYNHTITFEKEVVRFNNVTAFGGVAELIYNNNDDVVTAKLTSPDHGEVTVTLGVHELYLVAHPRPRRTVD